MSFFVNEIHNVRGWCIDFGRASPQPQRMSIANFLMCNIYVWIDCCDRNPSARFLTALLYCRTGAFVQVATPIVYLQTFAQRFQWHRTRFFHITEIASLHFLRWNRKQFAIILDHVCEAIVRRSCFGQFTGIWHSHGLATSRRYRRGAWCRRKCTVEQWWGQTHGQIIGGHLIDHWMGGHVMQKVQQMLQYFAMLVGQQ